jgi:hypothetical protein
MVNMEKVETAEMEIPGECLYAGGEPVAVRPSQPTPRHTLYLSNLDDQRFLRFSIKYVYVFTADALRAALARVLSSTTTRSPSGSGPAMRTTASSS